MNLIAKEFPKYQPQTYVLSFDGDFFQRTAFLISFANSSQWGNNIHIAPNARIDDGLMDVCMVSEFPNYAIPSLVFSLLNQSIDTNKYDEMIRACFSYVIHEVNPVIAHQRSPGNISSI